MCLGLGPWTFGAPKIPEKWSECREDYHALRHVQCFRKRQKHSKTCQNEAKILFSFASLQLAYNHSVHYADGCGLIDQSKHLLFVLFNWRNIELDERMTFALCTETLFFRLRVVSMILRETEERAKYSPTREKLEVHATRGKRRTFRLYFLRVFFSRREKRLLAVCFYKTNSRFNSILFFFH